MDATTRSLVRKKSMWAVAASLLRGLTVIAFLILHFVTVLTAWSVGGKALGMLAFIGVFVSEAICFVWVWLAQGTPLTWYGLSCIAALLLAWTSHAADERFEAARDKMIRETATADSAQSSDAKPNVLPPHESAASSHPSDAYSPVLSTSQKAVMWVGIFLLAGMFAFPPWQVGMGTYGRSWSSGYRFIANPPDQAIGIDTTRLILQASVVLLVCGGMMVSLRRRT